MNEINPKELLRKLPGYKFLDSHFKVGSKIHVSDFYYAKKIFQNSTFAIRFSFILARDIEKIIKKTGIEAIKKNGLSLIGYGQYSDLLLSFTKKILFKRVGLKNDNLNYNVLTDSEEMKFTKKQSLHSYIIIITPVATTFSTSVKIERKILDYQQKRNLDVEILSPRLNILVISDLKSQNPRKETELEASFGWANKNMLQGTLDIYRHFDNKGSTIEQSFYYNLLSDWQEVEECKYCYPKDSYNQELPLLERPLFEADKNPFLPPPNFGIPRGRQINSDDISRSFILTPDMLYFGHHYRNDNHFSYSLDTERFLEKNLTQVNVWLQQIKESSYFKNSFSDSDNILIIAPSHHSNASFIGLVNDTLFYASANIIHYDPTRDYVQNFDIIYGSEVDKANKIVFIDDSLKSGSTFFKINHFIQSLTINSNSTHRSEKISSKNKIYLCLFLLNKAEPLTVQLVKEQLLKKDSLYSFANLHLYTASSHNSEPPLETEMKRYKQLIEESYLDSLKIHFIKHYSKLFVGKEDKYDSNRRIRHLIMLDSTHRVFQYFSNHTTSPFTFESFEDFAKEIRNSTNTVITLPESYSPGSDFLSEFDTCLLKVIAQLPFTLYQPLRKSIFEWVLSITNRFITELNKEDLYKEFNYNKFQLFKFLIRRLGLLNSNFLITYQVLDLILKISGAEGIPKLISQMGKDDIDKIKKLQSFGVFYCSQVKELLFSNQARCIQLEKNVSSYKLIDSNAFKQITRILRVENSILIERFYEYLKTQDYWPPAYDSDSNILSISSIKNVIEQNINNRNFFYLAVEKFFNASGQTVPAENNAFLNYLWLKWYLEPEQQDGYIPLLANTEKIFNCLTEILNTEATDSKRKYKTGVFFIVNDNLQTPLIFYDRNPKSLARFESELLTNQFLIDFLNGVPDETGTYKKSIIELRKSDDELYWEDLYAVFGNKQIPKLDTKIFSKEYNRLLLVRLNKRKMGVHPEVPSDKGQGIIGFYYKEQDFSEEDKMKIRDINIVRYLHILRKPLSDFVEKHLENNEFTDWRVSENTKRLLLLSGHGKEMLQQLAKKNDIYRTIVMNLEHIQVIFLLNESAKSKNDKDDVKSKFNKFYRIENSSYIDRRTILKYEEMAKEIYKLPDVENSEDFNGVSSNSENCDFVFPFSKSILDVICFEVFVNAKKNRWVFSEITNVPGFTNNKLIISAKISDSSEDSFLEIEIRSTGPEISAQLLSDLNDRYTNPKKGDVTAGTALIKTLLKDFGLGEIKFSTESIIPVNLAGPVVPGAGFGWFIVTLTLKKMY